jgi:zinc finger SWIM domain-containing protein 3
VKCAISTYEVIEYVIGFGNQVEKTFVVYFNKYELEVKCTYALFELRDILCKHSISVLMTKNVRTLPSRYILDRWRKDIKWPRKATVEEKGFIIDKVAKKVLTV